MGQIVTNEMFIGQIYDKFTRDKVFFGESFKFQLMVKFFIQLSETLLIKLTG